MVNNYLYFGNYFRINKYYIILVIIIKKEITRKNNNNIIFKYNNQNNKSDLNKPIYLNKESLTKVKINNDIKINSNSIINNFNNLNFQESKEPNAIYLNEINLNLQN